MAHKQMGYNEDVIKMNEVVLLTGAGQIGMAIARRIGHGKK